MRFYKMRAECLIDVARLLPTLGRGGLLYRVEILQPDAAYPDVVVTFEHAQDLEHLRCIIATQADAHVMAQTLQLEENFTGERNTIEA